MSISNLERKIRFSDCTMEEYRTLESTYRHQMLPILLENKDFLSILESKGDGSQYVKPKAEIEREATIFAESGDEYIRKFGDAVLNFLAEGGKDITEVLLTIDGLLIVGGVTLTTTFTLIIAVILYAVTVMPAEILKTALQNQYDRIGYRLYGSNATEKAKAYDRITNEICARKGVHDIHKLAKMVPVSESMNDFIGLANQGVLEHQSDINPELKAYCSILESVNNRLGNVEDGKTNYMAMEAKLAWIGELAPSDYTYQSSTGIPTMESVVSSEDNGLDLFATFENIVGQDMLSGDGLLHGVICIVTDTCDKTSVLQFLNCYKNTAKYEFTHESFKDVPLLATTGAVLEFVQKRCGDNQEMLENLQHLDQLFAEVMDSAYEEVKEEATAGGPAVCAPSTAETGFCPNQRGIGELTPFPVASRRVGTVLSDIWDADSDEEINEAMLQFARVSSIINENYYVEESDDGSVLIMETDISDPVLENPAINAVATAVGAYAGYKTVEHLNNNKKSESGGSKTGKMARRAESKANQAFAKSATKDKTEGVGQAVKRTVDPMEKFFNQQIEKVKQADANERRNIILKGGWAYPKILRWIKRGIGLGAMSAVGTVFTPAAILAGIAFIAYIATDKYLDTNERQKILKELEDEIQIVNEKIEDSRGDDNKQKKYELMRIRNQLNRTYDKVKLNLKY